MEQKEPTSASGGATVGWSEPPATALEEFASVLAHELGTPLAIIATAAEAVLTRPTPEPDEQQRLLEMIRRNSQLAELLLGRLSRAREVEAGRVHLRRSAVDLVALVRETVGDLRAMILTGHPVAVTGAEAVHLDADPTAVREIVFNLLSNAAKYSRAGAPIDVDVSASVEHAEVVVRNHGTGVTPGDTERIFGKYTRTDANTSGAGLGLFISRGLARALGGDLTVQPAEEQGSEFKLLLPCRAAAGTPQPQDAQARLRGPRTD